MRNPFRNSVLAAASLSTAFVVPPEALAGPMSVAPAERVALAAPVSDVHYRRYRYGYYGYYPRHYRRYGYNPAGALFASAALGIMGAGIAAATAPRWGYGYGGWGGPWGYGGGWGPGWGYGRWGYAGWGPGWGGWW